jgi:hypothetical protein
LAANLEYIASSYSSLTSGSTVTDFVSGSSLSTSMFVLSVSAPFTF